MQKFFVVREKGPGFVAGWEIGKREPTEFTLDPESPHLGLWEPTSEYAIRKAGMVPGFHLRTIQMPKNPDPVREVIENENSNLEDPVDSGDGLGSRKMDQEEDQKVREDPRPKGKPGPKPGKTNKRR